MDSIPVNRGFDDNGLNRKQLTPGTPGAGCQRQTPHGAALGFGD